MAASSDDSDDDFVVLGTPVPEISDVEPLKKPTAVQDLTARDKQGRRRFHGAFTGGFSAGYFNTVGTKEGFTPSTFVSSRNKKTETKDGPQTRPEDFMDDEDMEEHGIAPRKFATASSFTSEERKRRHEAVSRQVAASSSLDLGTSLADLIVPETQPIGVKLLYKMGWRQGQGLGPRVRPKKKRKKKKVEKPSQKNQDGSSVKVYGCAKPPSDFEESDSDEFVPEDLSAVTFAPKDVTPIPLKTKDDSHGLGYSGLNPSLALPGSHISLFEAPPVRSGKGSKGIRGQAFGVGAFEDEDEDIYAVDSMSNYDMTMKGKDEEQDDKFGWTAPRQHGKQSVPVTYVGKLLEGFTLSKCQLKPKKKYPAPSLPRNFRPQHWFRKKREVSHIPAEVAGGDNQNDEKKKAMTAVDRGLMLGETPIMASVFDLIPKDDQKRIEATKEAIIMTKSLSGSSEKQDESLSSGPQPSPHEKIGETPASLATKFMSKFTPAANTAEKVATQPEVESKSHQEKAPLFQGGFNIQPFRKDPDKQARYDRYLALLKEGVRDPYSSVAVPNATEWDKARERDEFSKASKMYRPMSAMMSSRFVSGAMIDDDKEERSADDESDKSDQAKAAEMKMFGKLTREEFEWHPDKLLCRRFNVPNPYPESDIVGLPGVRRDKYSVFNFLSFGDFQSGPTQEPSSDTRKEKDQPTPSSEKTLNPKRSKKMTLASVFNVLDDPNFHHHSPVASSSEKGGKSAEKENDSEQELLSQGLRDDENKENNDDDEESPPDIDLFRAIFKNSDSEDSTDEEKDGKGDAASSSEDERKQSDEKEEDEKPGSEKDTKAETSPQTTELMSNTREDQSFRPLFTKRKKKDNEGNESSKEKQTAHGLGDSEGHVSKPEPEIATFSKRVKSRWGDKSVFSVLNQMEQDTSVTEENSTTFKTPALPAVNEMENVEEEEESYGPLPPPPSTSYSEARDTEEESRRRERSRERHSKKHSHRKEKRRKSKHKKEKKHKKHRKSSKSKRSKNSRSSSGSDADTESDSDVSDSELLHKLKQVSKNGKSKVFKNL